MRKSRLLTHSQVRRVNAVLAMLGYSEIAENDDSPSCYVATIIQQYRVDLDEIEVLAIVHYAMYNTIASHAACKLTLREIVFQYTY